MNQPDEGSIGDQVKRALEKGRRIQESVREITLKALSRREFDGEGIRKVTGEALDAIREAATVHGASAKAATSEALAGVNQALSHAAQSLSERADRFSREDLARARESLAEMGALSARMMDAGRKQLEAGMQAAISSGAIMARAASGALAGFASALEERQRKNEKAKEKKPDPDPDSSPSG